MSATTQKRKITQNDLRQMMQEKKRKLMGTERKIDSPLAKYADDGTLSCIICNSVVKTWHIHINSKQHHDNITRKKQSKEKPTPDLTPKGFSSKKEVAPVNVNSPVKLKGILKNKQATGPVSTPIPRTTNNEDLSHEMDVDSEVETSNNVLPEGFFDDPIMDAKARNVEYKDPLDEEMERFQREIQEENTQSEQMLDQDQETAAAEKQIEYIDEHIQLWSRIQTLEEKIENTRKITSERKNVGLSPLKKNEDEDSSYGSEEEFDEYIDWRSKKSFK